MTKNLKELADKSKDILKNEGIGKFIIRTKNWVVFNANPKNKKDKQQKMKDILFINGCPIDYCERYRVHHKMEELIAYGISSDEITPNRLDEKLIKNYRGFIIYRYPYDKKIEKFIKTAKENNKTVFYDIDDLVFDLKFTKDVKELKELTKEQRAEYDDGVVRYGKTLDLCDYGITTTKVLAQEMKKHVKDVCIDKNIASLKMIKYSNLAIKNVKKDNSKVIIGYPSGSTTHNADFKLVAPALLNILKKHNNVYIKLMGAIEIPKIFSEYEDRIIVSPFVDFTKLPYELRQLDINIAPLENEFFNTAKSSIKWMEAALVEVPTIASDVGDFHDSIDNMRTGLLTQDDKWEEKIELLIKNPELRQKIAKNAHEEVINNYQAIYSGRKVADFVQSKLKKNICFVYPSTNTSGGTLVATKHAAILKKNGYDVTIINVDPETSEIDKMSDGEVDIAVIYAKNHDIINTNIDTMVATMWFTALWAKSCNSVKKIKYLVQGKESLFYEPDSNDILLANSTYNYGDTLEYITISKWCKNFLKNDFGLKSIYAPNGIDQKMFPYKRRNLNGKIKILIEGNPGSYYKNVDESFKITNRLDRDKYEINFVSYNKKPKDWYRYDNFYNKVKHAEMYKIYQDADILIKSSLLESFSYPPLEMMATGGFVVVAPNEGNIEFLEDRKNCLFYKPSDIDDAIKKIEEVVSDKKLRNKLLENAKKTVKEREWNNLEKDIIALYE